MLKRFLARILHYKRANRYGAEFFHYKEDNMATRRKLTLVNGTIDQEGRILMYRAANSFEIACAPYSFTVPLVPFPDDDDWDDFDQAE